MYNKVLEVQLAQIEMIRPGVKTKDIHKLGCDMFIEAGYHIGKEGFAHATGHGFGLEIHESPRLANWSEEVLEAGNIITIEPGLYYPALGGVRIEDDILVTQNGHENLTNLDKEFRIF